MRGELLLDSVREERLQPTRRVVGWTAGDFGNAIEKEIGNVGKRLEKR